MIKVLFFIDRLRFGGIQALALDIVKHYDRSKMRIDILNLNDGIDYPLTDQMRELGVTVYRINAWIRSPFDFPKYFSEVDRFFAEHHDYDAVHMHSSSKNYYILKCAAKWEIPVRVAHSHNTGFQTHNPLSIVFGNVLKRPLMKYATDCVGCSAVACQWLFGKDCIESGRAKVILNAIDAEKFVFNSQIRNEVREELGIQDKFVVGHIGRFERQKNHKYLIKVFSEISKKRGNALLILIGTGSLTEAIKEQVEGLDLSDKVMFLGFRDDNYRLLQAMDAFLFPSLYEGLSVVLIEAQTAGLPVFASNTTTNEVAFSPNIIFLPIDKEPEYWADYALKNSDIERLNMMNEIKSKGFEINTMVENLYSLYTEKQ